MDVTLMSKSAQSGAAWDALQQFLNRITKSHICSVWVFARNYCADERTQQACANDSFGQHACVMLLFASTGAARGTCVRLTQNIIHELLQAAHV